MTSVGKIDLFMSEWAKKELSEPWDNDGVMLCGDIDRKVSKILVCLEVNDSVIKKAVDCKADLVVTHHPFIFNPIKNLCGTICDKVFTLLKNNISVLSYHTRLDAAKDGVNDVLAKALELENILPFAQLGRVGELSEALSVSVFCHRIKQKLQCENLRISQCTSDKKIKRVAVLGGAGKDFIPDAAEVADAYVTGDISHSAFILANDLGIFAVDAGHYCTENPVVEKISAVLSQNFPDVEVISFDSGCPYTQI